jgi:hypothetical protein
MRNYKLELERRMPQTGRSIKEDGTTANVADMMEAIYTAQTKDYYGLSTDVKPDNSQVPIGAIFFEIDTTIVYMNDGTKWVAI